jgi:hypothetical protein
MNLDHRVRSNLQFSFSGYHMRSDRDLLPSDAFFQFLQQAPDVDLLMPDPDGTRYIFEPDLQGVTPNPLYELVTSRDDENRARTLASSDLRWTPFGWINVDAQRQLRPLGPAHQLLTSRGVATPTSLRGRTAWCLAETG